MMFSIITPSFNSEKTIGRTIESILNQTMLDYEYIIVDGASTDKTVEIIRSYEEKFDGRLKLISEPDKGIYDAMNKGIDLAEGRIIGIVNSDDYYENNCLQLISKSFVSSCPYQVLYGMTRIVDFNNNELSIEFKNHINLLKGMMIPHPSCFITRALYKDIGKYNTNFKSASDYDFLLSIAKHKNVKFCPIYNVLSNFALGGISQSYIAAQESNYIRYKHGFISFKWYCLVFIKNLIKRYL